MKSESKSGLKRFEFMYAEIRRIFGEAKERTIHGPQGAEVCMEGLPMLNFSSNDYLGLCNNSKVKEGAKKAIDSHGFGAGSVRLLSGTQDIHKTLEKELAAFIGTEDCILFPTCYAANGAVFESLLGDKDAIISDELNHASIVDGVRLCKAKRLRYKHLDMVDLERALKEAEGADIKMIVTDGSFSMDGDIAPLPEIIALAKKYGALTLVDESHSSGVFGKTGRGTFEHFNVVGEIDIITSTLGKGLGGATGGFLCSYKSITELLRYKARTYIFSNAIPPPIVGGSIEALRLIQESPDLIAKVQEATKYFREGMKKKGYILLGHENSPICPALLYEEKTAIKLSQELFKKGIHTMPICYPVVPKGMARIRITISGAHTCEHLDKFIQAFDEVITELGIKKE